MNSFSCSHKATVATVPSPSPGCNLSAPPASAATFALPFILWAPANELQSSTAYRRPMCVPEDTDPWRLRRRRELSAAILASHGALQPVRLRGSVRTRASGCGPCLFSAPRYAVLRHSCSGAIGLLNGRGAQRLLQLRHRRRPEAVAAGERHITDPRHLWCSQ